MRGMRRDLDIEVDVLIELLLARDPVRFFANEPDRAQAMLAAIPLGRVGDTEQDIGRAVAFIVGPGARYMTGVTIPLDGGASYIR
jgi:NAD(P)-dependent dehydrogenase (short-subunit alcohol dehydrogenase family)